MVRAEVVLVAVGAVAAALLVKRLADGAGSLASSAVETAEQVFSVVNPVNPENVFASGVNSVGAKLSGDDEWTLGGWIYDITHRGE